MSNQLRGVSAVSRDAVLAAVDAASGSSAALGSQLFGVVSTLDSSPALRRVLTDPSTEASAKADLVSSLFGSAVSADTLAVARVAAGGRWSAGRDLGDALEVAAVAAVVNSAESDGAGETLESELFGIGRTVASSPELRVTLSDSSIAASAKAELLTSIFGGKVTASALALAIQAVGARTASFEKTLASFAALTAERRSRLLAQVRVAQPLGQAEHDRLATALTRKYGRDVHLDVVIDPAVIGGISVSVADDVVDGTMSSRLEVARRRIAG